ncbi:Coenzyme Q-binding protein coq10, mitochondrial [Polyrhizophydium stewartii]|uniref:Coenzyme Q-binding protein coq10, mitochondrial n=1 Tax=Polyrhizophydium stewartii TaxID=2732419 RepID=A0ABR4NE30_9FUNG|nr:Coenzyme Q-binding protein coq10a, mitochondrial [Polyrhizophydium stewartii]
MASRATLALLAPAATPGAGACARAPAHAAVAARRTFLTALFDSGPQSSVQQYRERRVLGYSAAQMCALVSDVDQYSRFVPWCVGSRVLSRHATRAAGAGAGARAGAPTPAQLAAQPELAGTRLSMRAELSIGFQAFSEAYTSTVTCEHPTLVRAVASNSSVFKTLVNEWRFQPVPPALRIPGPPGSPPASGPFSETDLRSCLVDFSVAFEFNNALYAQASGLFLDEVSKMMVTAFERRALEIYGRPSRPSRKL